MFRLISCAVVCLGTISSGYAGIVVNGGSFYTQAYENNIGGGSATTNVLPLPLQTTDTTTAPSGNATATSTYDLTATGDSASFQFDFSHTLHSDLTTNILGTQSARQDPLTFTVTGANPLQYSLNGFFNLTGEAEIVSMGVTLYDLTHLIVTPFGTFPTTVFRNYQESANVTDASFLLGGTQGNNGNFLNGNTTGLLMPGVKYALDYNFYIQDDNMSPVSGVGGLNMTISPVPEPSSLMLLGIGCCSLCSFGRKRNRRLAA